MSEKLDSMPGSVLVQQRARLSVSEMAEKYGVNRQKVYKRLKVLGVLGPRARKFSKSDIKSIKSRLRFGESKYALAAEFKTTSHVIEMIGVDNV